MFLVLILLGCGQNTFDTEKELLDHITKEENGYIQHKSVNGYEFSLLYRPTDLLVRQELGESTTKEQIQELRDKYRRYIYFNLSMSRDNQELLSVAPEDRRAFGAMVNQLAFGMGDKVHLFTQSKDTIQLMDFVYPRMYGMGQSTTIMFVYPRNKDMLKEEYLNFTVEDLGLYTGEVKFKIDVNKIEQEPQLVFKRSEI